MIGKFAKEFNMDPDLVYLKQFSTVVNFLALWKAESEFNDRFSELGKAEQQK